MIPNDFIQSLLSRVDIVDVVERYVPLKKAGANYVACCPFHSEKSPSFTVTPTKQFYHCFGCGAHGTAVGFLIEHAGMTFPEAVEQLAQQVGLTVPRTGNRESSGARRDELSHFSDLLDAASLYYKNQLKASPRAIAYLKGRGLTGEIAARFRLGYAPDGWQNLEHAVPDYEDKALETVGLVIVGEGSKRYDRFRDRIMFPITDAQGRNIGFGGRVLDSGEPKYLNSPETPLFVKGRELYGLFQARQAIREAGLVIVVEGYMDVVALAQHGVGYAVATLGTATTGEHVKKLFRQADRIVFCFDGDAAGQRAAWRALENALPSLTDGKETAFLFLPEEHDPDSYVREFGRKAFEEALANATPLSEYFIEELERRHPTETAEGRAALVAEARPYFESLAAPLLRLLLSKRLAEVAGLTAAELEPLLPAAKSKPLLSGADDPGRSSGAGKFGGSSAASGGTDSWGPYGEHGERGDAAERGNRGDGVDHGDRGNRGDRADRGDRGDRGSHASHGSHGDTGDRGNRPPGPGSRARGRSGAPQAPGQGASAGPYLAIIRYLLQRPTLIESFTEASPEHPSREARALAALVDHLREHAEPGLTTGPLVEALQESEFAAIYQRVSRLIADLGDTGEDEAAFIDALAQYRAFEQKFARQLELSRLSDDQR
jgi:DNA primase